MTVFGVFATVWVWLQIPIVWAGLSRAMNSKQVSVCWAVLGEWEVQGASSCSLKAVYSAEVRSQRRKKLRCKMTIKTHS